MKTIKIKENIQKKKWEVVENFAYRTIDGKNIFYIPKGFLSDGASVPRIFRSIYPKCKIGYMTASVVHDFILEYIGDRDLADMVFREILDETTDETTEGIFYSAVRLWSWIKRR